MGFRITTNMMINSYRYNLHGSTKKLSDSIDMVLTGRNYNSYAEDPAAATQEFRLRRTYYRTSSQLSNNKSVYSKYNTAWNNLQGIKTKLIDETAIQAVMRGDNGPTGEARQALATTLRETSESLIYALNQKLGDQFIFSGNDGLNVPFEWKVEDGVENLYYRGINVKAGGVQKPTAPEPDWLADAKAAAEATNGGKLTDGEQAWYDYYTHVTDVRPDSEEYTKPNVISPPVLGGTDETTTETVKYDEPDWLKSPPLNPTGPEEEGWLKYYLHEADAPPVANEPDWAAYEAYFDRYGAPDIEKLKNDPASGFDEDDPITKEWLAYYQDQADLAKLKEMSGEEMYIDLGMGLAENAPNDLVNGSYFNSALCGIDFIDFGVDEDGDPKNLALLMREFADIFQAWDEDMEPQGYNPDLAGPTAVDPATGEKLTSAQMEEKAYRLLDKFKDSREYCVERWDELDAESVFLVTNQERLETQLTDTNTEILDVSQVNMADAITALSWQQYCYNAALKIGNQLLSQSLIDYMR